MFIWPWSQPTCFSPLISKRFCAGLRISGLWNYSRLPLFGLWFWWISHFLANSIPTEGHSQCPCISVGSNIRYFDPKVGLCQIIRTWQVGTHAPAHMVTPLVAVSASAEHRDSECIKCTSSRVENAYYQPALGRFSNNNRSSQWPITLFIQL